MTGRKHYVADDDPAIEAYDKAKLEFFKNHAVLGKCIMKFYPDASDRAVERIYTAARAEQLTLTTHATNGEVYVDVDECRLWVATDEARVLLDIRWAKRMAKNKRSNHGIRNRAGSHPDGEVAKTGG